MNSCGKPTDRQDYCWWGIMNWPLLSSLPRVSWFLSTRTSLRLSQQRAAEPLQQLDYTFHPCNKQEITLITLMLIKWYFYVIRFMSFMCCAIPFIPPKFKQTEYDTYCWLAGGVQAPSPLDVGRKLQRSSAKALIPGQIWREKIITLN